MSKRSVRLTEAHLRGPRALPPGDGREITYSDAVQRGLRFRVRPSGERSFLVAYQQPKDGASVKLKLGSLADGITLAQARREVRDCLALLRREPPIDPGEERKKRRELAQAEDKAIRFRDVCRVFEETELPHFRPATAAGWSRFIKAEIVPALGDLKPEEITSEHVAEMVAAIEARAATSARRCFEVVRRILTWASTTDADVAAVRRRHGIARLDVNPATSARSYRGKRQRKRDGKTRAQAATKALSDEQLRAVVAATEDEPSFGELFALVAHTAVRAHDARAARWTDIDRTRELWSIPVHKTSDQTGAPHVVPLSSGALDVLNRIRKANLAAGRGSSPWLFPAPTAECEVCGEPGHFGKDAKTPARIKQAAEIEGRGLLHRMRDTIKTRMSEHGIDGRVSEAVLGHLPPGIVGTYDHAELLPQRREALGWWSAELGRIVGKKGPAKARRKTARR